MERRSLGHKPPTDCTSVTHGECTALSVLNASARSLGRAIEGRHPAYYAVENAPNHFSKMQNYVALYGFFRTLTPIAVLLFWVIV